MHYIQEVEKSNTNEKKIQGISYKVQSLNAICIQINRKKLDMEQTLKIKINVYVLNAEVKKNNQKKQGIQEEKKVTGICLLVFLFILFE